MTYKGWASRRASTEGTEAAAPSTKGLVTAGFIDAGTRVRARRSSGGVAGLAWLRNSWSASTQRTSRSTIPAEDRGPRLGERSKVCLGSARRARVTGTAECRAAAAGVHRALRPQGDQCRGDSFVLQPES